MRNKGHGEGSEPCQDFRGSLESQRKGDLEDRFRRLAWDKLLLPIAALAARFLGSLEFRRCRPVGGGGRGAAAPGKEGALELCLRGFIGWEFEGTGSDSFCPLARG